MLEDLLNQRVTVTCRYDGWSQSREFTGHYKMLYHVSNIVTKGGTTIATNYTFKNIKGFKKRGFKPDDILEFSVVPIMKDGELVLKLPRGIEKIS
ncbi:hypothetical protein D3C81_11550 [compost metagenome]